MANRSKAKGTAFETAVVEVMQERCIHAYRPAPAGAQDKGDIVTPGYPLAWECKNVRAMDLAGWVDEAKVEAANAGQTVGVVVHKRRGYHAREAYVTMSLAGFLDLLESIRVMD